MVWRVLARAIWRNIWQPIFEGGGGDTTPGFPFLRFSPIITAGDIPSGSAPYESASSIGDRHLVLVTAGPGGPSIDTPAGWTELDTQTTVDGVTASWFYHDALNNDPISVSFAFPDDNSWVVVRYVFQAGSFDPLTAPAIIGAVESGADPEAPDLVYGWGPFIGTYNVCSMSTISGNPVTAWPLPNTQAYTESTGGEGAGLADVGVGDCSILSSGSGITPGNFVHADTGESAVFTVAVKGVV